MTPSLRGRHVELRAVMPTDEPFLRLAESSGDLVARWRFRGRTLRGERGAADTLVEHLVLDRATGERVGVIALYKPDHRDGHAWLAAARLQQQTRSPLLIVGLAVFLRYVFACWDFHKLYMELPEYNLEQFGSGLGRLFEEEGRLRDHYWFDGQRWDQIVLALYRDRWMARPKPILAAETP
jgi:hypothetical protein